MSSIQTQKHTSFSCSVCVWFVLLMDLMLFYLETHCWHDGAFPHMTLFLSQVKVIAEDQAQWEDKVFVTEPFSQLPPLATTSCRIEDRGNHTQHGPPSSVLWSQRTACVLPLSSDAAEYKMSHQKPACCIFGVCKYIMSNPGLVFT